MSRRTPAPLRFPDGRVARFARAYQGSSFSNAGAPLPGRIPSLDKLVTAMPFRSVLSRRWPAEIAAVLAVPAGDSVPPPFIVKEMGEEIAAGRGILLLATDRNALNRAKVILTGLLLPARGRA